MDASAAASRLQFVVRFPAGMRDEIQALARANGRSINSEIIIRLASTLRSPTQELTQFTCQDEQMNDRHQIAPYTLRIPPDLRGKLEASSEAGSRSLHAEIVWRLSATYPSSGESVASLVAIPTQDLLAELGRRCK